MKRNFLKQLLSISLVFTFVLTLVACGGGDHKSESKKTADNKFGKLDIEIPSELKDNPEAVAYIESMIDITDEYALLIDDLYEEAGEFAGKEMEELSMTEKLKLASLTASYAMNSGEVLMKWADCESKRAAMYENLDDEELAAMEVVYNHVNERFEQIEKKYENLEQ